MKAPETRPLEPPGIEIMEEWYAQHNIQPQIAPEPSFFEKLKDADLWKSILLVLFIPVWGPFYLAWKVLQSLSHLKTPIFLSALAAIILIPIFPSVGIGSCLALGFWAWFRNNHK
jgi:hypothetical protein